MLLLNFWKKPRPNPAREGGFNENVIGMHKANSILVG
jgi:hypothetical protein